MRTLIAVVATVSSLALAGCARSSGETYGLVATLGNDTTSVERVRRTRDRIVSDAIGRSPRVVRRHWEADLAPDGSVTKWSLDTFIPSAPLADQNAHYTADFSGAAIALSRTTSAGTRKWAYRKQFARTVPWNAFVYETYELLLDAARRAPPTAQLGVYFFEGWDAGHLGAANVERSADGSYRIATTGLSGTGEARIDSSGRLVSYSGEGTTYKQLVHRVVDPPDIDSITARFAAAERRTGTASELSPRDTVRAAVAGAQLTIDYGRPAMRGRTLVGALLPYGQVWRTGANAATQFTTTQPIALGGVRLAAGTYTLWTLPTERGVSLIINRQTGQWGTDYDSKDDLARVPMAVEDSVMPGVERFTIRVGAAAGHAVALIMEWGNFRWSVPIRAG